MNIFVLHFRGLFAIVAALALFAAGCGCGDDDDDDDDSSGDDDPTDDDTADDDATDDDTGDDDADDDTVDDDADDDTSDDDTGDDDSAEPLVEIDFNDYDTGPLDAPWTVDTDGSGTADIVPVVKDGSGKQLKISGGSTQDEYLDADYEFDSSTEDVSIVFEIWRASGASFRFGAADSDGFGRFFAVVDASGELYGTNLDPYSGCSIFLDAETWYELRVEMTQSGTPGYDILVDGAPTTCDDFAFQDDSDPNIAAIHFADDAANGYGGDVYYDNLVIDLL